jgi:hypothetical protein
MKSISDDAVAQLHIPDIFSMCLGPDGGMLTLGGINDSYSAGPMTFTPIITETYYVVNMQGLSVNGASVRNHIM